MKGVNLDRVRELFGTFDFSKLFIEELHWSRPTGLPQRSMIIEETAWTERPIAQLGGVAVIEVMASNGDIPDAKTRTAIHREIAKAHYENLLIFVDQERVRSEWFWVKRENGKELPRPHPFVRGQQGDLFLGKIGPLFFDEHDFTGGDPSVIEVARRLRLGLDVEKVTKKFYKEFQEQHLQFIELISGIADDRQRRWYASVLLNRLMFIWFLQRKGFVDGGNLDYLQAKLDESRGFGRDRYFQDFLRLLFFEGFAKPEHDRSLEAKARLGNIRYLNGGLFLPHTIEQSNPDIDVPDRAFENLFTLFRSYTWNLNDTPGSDSDEINPDVLGYIFEKYINQKAFGAYYTRPEITTYLCERTIHRLILDAVNTPEELKKAGLAEKTYAFKSIGDLFLGLDNFLCRRLLFEVLPKLSILDPACGSGAFLVAAMKTLMNVYGALTGFARLNGDADLKRRMRAIEKDHPSINYYIKKSIITNNLYGVDIMEEAVEIARLRLFLTLVSSAHSVDDLEPLPNIDFNLLAGNSLIGLLRVDERKFDEQISFSFLRKTYRQVVDDKTRQVAVYRDATSYATDLRQMRDDIDKLRAEARVSLDDILLQQFKELGIKYEQATWDEKKQREGKGIKRPLTAADIEDLQPFHWGYEFDEIVNKRGGFDAIITNPPWEILKPNSKEFFEHFSTLVSRKKMRIEDFDVERARLLVDPDIGAAWLEYLSRHPHQSAYFRGVDDFAEQSGEVDGKRTGTDINLYKLFVERCFRLLREGGDCGVVVPSGLYTDLGATQLRRLLFDRCDVQSVISLSNERFIFDGVDHRFKLTLIVFRRGGTSSRFKAAFRIDPREAVAPNDLAQFLLDDSQHVDYPVPLVRLLSPTSLSVVELKNDQEVAIARKLAKFPSLGSEAWSELALTNEFHMSNDRHLFRAENSTAALPLFEGKAMNQYQIDPSAIRYWILEPEGRAALLGRSPDTGQILDYQEYRLALRRIARNTDKRTLIATVLPERVFASESFHLSAGQTLPPRRMCYVTALFNSFVFDYQLRQRVSANISMFHVYQLFAPALAEGDWKFQRLVQSAIRLLAPSEEYQSLAQLCGEAPLPATAISAETRLSIIAEVDALIAQAFDLSEEELRYILATFYVTDSAQKEATLTEFSRLGNADSAEIRSMCKTGESARLEFKSTARWDLKLLQVNKALEQVVVKTIASFMNSDGGTLLIGVADSGEILGLTHDFQSLGKKANADAFENWLMTRLLEGIDRDRIRLVHISFQTIEGKTVCRVDVDRSPRPVYLAEANGGEKFWVRMGNSTRDLSISEAHAYVDEHFRAPVVEAPAAMVASLAADVGSAKSEAQGRLPIQSPSVRPKVDLAGHGLFRKQEAARPAPTPAEPEGDADDGEEDASPRRRLIDEFEVDDVLAIIRDVINSADPIPREEAIKAIATPLGAERVGARIQEFIEGHLNTASRRHIIETCDGGLVASTRSIDDYDRDFLKTVLKAVIGRTWTDEDEAIRAGTRYLGFRRTGPRISKAFKSAINGLLRQNELERNARTLRRPIQ